MREKTVIGYIGSLASYHGMDVLFEVADEIVSRRDVAFLIIGDNKKLDCKWQQFSENKNEMIKMAGKVSHDEIRVWFTLPVEGSSYPA